MTRKLLCFFRAIIAFALFFPVSATAESFAKLEGSTMSAFPLNVQIVSRGLTWVHLKWSPVPGATSYQLVTHPVMVAGQSSTMLVSGTEAVIEDLAFAVTYHTDIYPSCPAGCQETTGGQIDYSGIIIDLDIKHNPPNFFRGTPGNNFSLVQCDCTFDVTPAAPVWATVTGSGIGDTPGIAFLPFKIYISGGEVHLKEAVSDNQIDACLVIPGNNCTSYGNTDAIDVKGVQNILGHISFDVTHGEGADNFTVSMHPTLFAGGYHLYYCNFSPQGKVAGGNQGPTEYDPDLAMDDRDNRQAVSTQTTMDNQWKTMSPFSEYLPIWVPGNKGACNVKIYNQQGNCLYSQVFEEQADNYALPTESLPQGMYFIRIEADGKVKTLKAVKSE